MKALVFDYGAGNLHSLARALEAIGVTPTIEADPVACARSSELLVLPGVGAFGAAVERLAPGRAALREELLSGRPCLGICLGLQLFFDSSEEGGGAGLGVIPGAVTRLTSKRCPHIGWTKVDGLPEMYFAHSFACRSTPRSCRPGPRTTATGSPPSSNTRTSSARSSTLRRARPPGSLCSSVSFTR